MLCVDCAAAVPAHGAYGMKTRKLGSLQVSEIGFGNMTLNKVSCQGQWT
jgi:hypothetical protein